MAKYKKRLLFILCTVMLASIPAGCGSKKEDQLAKLEKKVTELQNDIEELQAVKEEKETEAVSNSDAEDKSSATLEGLTASVERIKEDTDTLIPAKTEAERMTQYFDLKNKMKSLEERIDAYDDNLEIQYKNHTLSYTDYCIQERSAEDLTDQLENFETALQQTLRVDNQADLEDEDTGKEETEDTGAEN